MKKDKEKLGVATLNATFTKGSEKYCNKVEIGFGLNSDFKRDEKSEFTNLIKRWYKKEFVPKYEKRFDVKLVRLTVRYKYLECDFIINDKAFLCSSVGVETPTHKE